MSNEPRSASWRLIAAIVTLATVWLVMLRGGTGPLDRAFYQALYAGHRPALVAAARFFTVLGEPTVLIAACAASALWLWHAGRGRLGVVLLLIAGLGRAL